MLELLCFDNGSSVQLEVVDREKNRSLTSRVWKTAGDSRMTRAAVANGFGQLVADLLSSEK
jgi:hypothetical protein